MIDKLSELDEDEIVTMSKAQYDDLWELASIGKVAQEKESMLEDHAKNVGQSSSDSRTSSKPMARPGFGREQGGPHLGGIEPLPPEKARKRPIGEKPQQSPGRGTRVGTETQAQTIEVLRKFSFWSGMGSIALLTLLILLTINGVLPTQLLTVAIILLLAATGLFLKLWYDLGN